MTTISVSCFKAGLTSRPKEAHVIRNRQSSRRPVASKHSSFQRLFCLLKSQVGLPSAEKNEEARVRQPHCRPGTQIGGLMLASVFQCRGVQQYLERQDRGQRSNQSLASFSFRELIALMSGADLDQADVSSSSTPTLTHQPHRHLARAICIGRDIHIPWRC